MEKIKNEKATLTLMIKIYCRKKHGSKNLCDACKTLLSYALNRLDHCRYGENKGFCNTCSTHCYNKAHREQIRKVMTFSGPRMIFYHPLMAIRHLLS
nr:nitrous oxide-stimulated promoter family protein [uncultured Acetobacterium sp.]